MVDDIAHIELQQKSFTSTFSAGWSLWEWVIALEDACSFLDKSMHGS
jgi:hypothetical protein